MGDKLCQIFPDEKMITYAFHQELFRIDCRFFSCRMPPGAPRGSTRLLRGPRDGPGALGSTLVPTPWPEVVPGAVPGEPQEKPTRSQGSPRRSQKAPEEAQEGPRGGLRGPLREALGGPWRQRSAPRTPGTPSRVPPKAPPGEKIIKKQWKYQHFQK